MLRTDLGVSSPLRSADHRCDDPPSLGRGGDRRRGRQGTPRAVNALDAQALQLSGLAGTIQLGDLLQIDPNQGSLTDIDVNALDLFTGLFSSTTSTTSRRLRRRSRSRTRTSPHSVCRPRSAASNYPPGSSSPRSSFTVRSVPSSTAAIRLKLDLNNLVGLDLDTSGLLDDISAALGIPVNLLGVTADVSDLQVYVEVASASGTIQSIDAISAAVGVQAARV